MNDMTTLTLAGQQFEAATPPLCNLKKIISGLNRVSASDGDLDVIMTEAPLMIALLIGKTPDELDNMAIGYTELLTAFNLVPGICGMIKKESTLGEVLPGNP